MCALKDLRNFFVKFPSVQSPHWDHYKEEKIVTAMQSESITAIAFWYEICLADKYIINTGPEFSVRDLVKNINYCVRLF